MAATVHFYLNTFVFSFLTILCFGSEKLVVISPPELESLIKDEPYVVVFLTSATGKTCDSAEKVLTRLIQDSSAIDVKIVKTSNEAFAKQYGSDYFPNLLYFRDQRPMIYDGGFVRNEILDWLLNNKGVHVQHLSDETFEHLTQVSAGATTGDWFVLFYQSSQKNQTFMPTWDTVAGRLNGKVNVAKLDVDLSRETEERFHNTESTNLLFFRLGKTIPL